MPQDYTVEKRTLGPTTKAVDMKILDAGHAKVTNQIWKDWKEKKELKQSIHLLAEYIHSLQSAESESQPQAITMIDVTSLTN